MSTYRTAPDTDTHIEDGYRGAATLELDSVTLEVEVVLHGHFEPIDGIYRWYGRVLENPRLSEHVARSKATVTIHTPTGSASATVGEPDIWDRYRITGRHHPPYRLSDPTTTSPSTSKSHR